MESKNIDLGSADPIGAPTDKSAQGIIPVKDQLESLNGGAAQVEEAGHTKPTTEAFIIIYHACLYTPLCAWY